MTPDGERADRMQTLRAAAGDWLRAGWISEDGRRAIDSLYPDDRVRTGPAFRIFFFVLTLGALIGLVGVAYAQIGLHVVAAAIAWVTGLSCALATHYMVGALKRRQGGIEAALSLAALVNLIAGAAISLDEFGLFPDWFNTFLLMFLLALLSSGAAWLWGYWPYAALSAYALFCSFLALPAGRLLWVLGLLALVRRLISGCDAGSLPPSQRKSVTAFLAVGILALYAAIHVSFLDQGSPLPGLGLFGVSPAGLPHWLTIPLTALVPVTIFVIGVVVRRRLFVNLGFVLMIGLLLTLRQYLRAAPLWLILTGAGVLLLAAAAALRRFLDSGAGHERFGFTAASLREILSFATESNQFLSRNSLPSQSARKILAPEGPQRAAGGKRAARNPR